MLKQLYWVWVIILVVGCAKEESNQNFIVQGNIEGLKKGTIYLQKLIDSSFVTIDSLSVSGNSNFKFSSELEEPEVLFLRLNKNDDDESAISFFADTGTTTINSSLKNYIFDAKIDGSRHQKILEEYLEMMYKFNDQNLDLIKESLEARSKNDSNNIKKIETDFDNLLKRKYRYTINFAFNNNDSEVSPYLAVNEIPNANPKYLDTIYGALTERVKNSKYGKQLKSLIEDSKQR